MTATLEANVSTNGHASTKPVAAKKPAAKKAAKASPAKKTGLRKPQIKILACLKRFSKPMTKAQIAAKAPVDVAGCCEWIGSHNAEVRKANDAKHFPSLVSLGYVKHDEDEEHGHTYEITAKGRAALDAAK